LGPDSTRNMVSNNDDLGGGWRFHRGEAAGSYGTDYDLSSWEKVRIPHTFNADDTFTPERGYYRGPSWYRRDFTVDDTPSLRSLLRFEAVWGVTQVWINGQRTGEYDQGLAGFEIDATPYLERGQNSICVRVDNSHQEHLLPGKSIPDYNIYGGISGPVHLARYQDPFLVWRSSFIRAPEPSRPGRMLVTGNIEPGSDRSGKMKVEVAVYDSREEEILNSPATVSASGDGYSTRIDIPDPETWSPASPEMYRADISLIQGGEIVDRESVTFGIRTAEFDSREGFRINGDRLQLRGVNRHQDFPGLGNVLSPRLNRRDAEIIKEMGANFVRTSHYPQSPVFLDTCDRLGIVVYEEITSWQFIGGDPFIRTANRIMEAMVRRDRNHPCVALWGMFNEGRSPRLLKTLSATAKRLDPTRPTIYADNKLDQGAYLGTTTIPDVLGINYKLDTLDDFHRSHPSIKILVSEHTNADATKRGSPQLEREQARRISNDLDIIESRPFVAGSALWSMHDYGTDYEPVWPVQKSGILDIYRNPKEAYHMLRARWRRSPVIHLAYDWTRQHVDGEPVEVRVYTNCDRVRLARNDEVVGERKGGNPVVWNIPLTEGELTAIGIEAGKEVVTDSMSTPGKASRLEIVGPGDMLSGGRDSAVLQARVIDDGGHLVPGYTGKVRFRSTGPCRLAGIGGSVEPEVVAGIANMVVSSTENPGEIIITCSSEGLTSGKYQLTSR